MTRLQPTEAEVADDSDPPERSLRVLVANETAAAIDAERLESAVRLAFADSGYTWVEVSIAVVDDEMIHELNRQFLDHDYPTDVLSFALEDDPPRLEGEIVVSLDTADRCASEAGWSTDDELLLYVAHGALHLAGYGDKTPEDAAEMRAAEVDLLAKLGATVSPGDSRWQPDAQEGHAS
ncbi:MAG: rRNA maturation RNase YbeY [Pirellulales bacterium]|nr:rRNA maturation RNase YbeY [Pirellulales bacterium]